MLCMGRPMEIDTDDIMDVFSHLEDSCEPMLATEVADRLDCSHTTARERLNDCVSMGLLRTKKLGPVRAFWMPDDGWDPAVVNGEE